MPSFRKKPVVIEARQWEPSSPRTSGTLAGWLMTNGVDFEIVKDNKLSIITLEGAMEASPGDWIIRGVKGEFYPCKPDIFEATYEPA